MVRFFVNLNIDGVLLAAPDQFRSLNIIFDSTLLHRGVLVPRK